MGYNKELTNQMLGDVGPLRFNPIVIKTCDSCHSINHVRYKGSKKPTAAYNCRKCVANRPDVKIKLSNAAKKQWEDEAFAELVRENSKRIWDDEERRYKMSTIRRDPNNTERLKLNARIGGIASIQSQENRTSSLQKILYSILDDLNIQYHKEFAIGPYVFDCLVNNILIECNGDYWHTLPKNSARDKAKRTYIERYHQQYILKSIWEHEFKNRDKIYQLLKNWLKINNEIIDFDFSEVKISKPSSAEYKKLLEKYHYLSSAGRGGIVYGGYLNNELISVIVFSPLSRQNISVDGFDISEVRELSRLCIKPTHQKRNFASWFISRCLKLLNKKYKAVISYADTTFNHNGAVYKASNFSLDSVTKPDYWYVSTDGWVMHKKTLYNHARSLGMTEKDFAVTKGYKIVWGREKLRYLYRR